MKPFSPQTLGRTLQLLAEMPPPQFPADNLDLLTLVCACGKRHPISGQKVIWTGGINIPDALCPDCRKGIGDYAHLVCVACRRVVTSVKPATGPDGFIFERGRYYHTFTCPVCDPALRGSQTQVAIIERHHFRKKNNLPI